ncbi:MAG: HIT domain-containing protein [Candidatus Zixiibacteriota bacterium]|jgi:histidine triad (HIT) family protein
MASIFTRIIKREAPAKIFYEDDEVIVIADRYPKDRVHLLLIPKEEHPTFFETPPSVLHKLNETAKMVVEKLEISDHFRIVINNGYGQEIFHVHYHLMSNRGADRVEYIEEVR